MRKVSWKSLITIFIFVVLSGCSSDVVDGDRHLSRNIHETMSNYIIEKYATSYPETDKQFEVHKVYGTSESDGILTVYMWSLFGGYNKETGLEEQCGHSLPAVIRLKNDSGEYKVIDYKEPKDGSEYLASIKKLFPKKYIKYIHRDAGNVKELQKEMDKKVEKWLNK
ncbi:hypothetical protein [Bacillus andreraoultii]|uniref:hypothetical protein n=1 Tax=Bacillus andreraoultii TaxID=1499685 RepID=UPI00067F23B9|nr:hypothetical protein [Bacillus andreraoultii]